VGGFRLGSENQNRGRVADIDINAFNPKPKARITDKTFDSNIRSLTRF
jgi:hypothetical protein